MNVCPPLFIPEGFFESDIKILYGSDERKSGYVNVNPAARNYSVLDSDGVDPKCTLEDLPLFWRSRISKIEYGLKLDSVSLLRHRNEEVLKSAWQLTQIPMDSIKVSLRFENTQPSASEWRRLRLFEFWCKQRRNTKSWLRSVISRVPFGSMLLAIRRRLRKQIA